MKFKIKGDIRPMTDLCHRERLDDQGEARWKRLDTSTERVLVNDGRGVCYSRSSSKSRQPDKDIYLTAIELCSTQIAYDEGQ